MDKMFEKKTKEILSSQGIKENSQVPARGEVVRKIGLVLKQDSWKTFMRS